MAEPGNKEPRVVLLGIIILIVTLFGICAATNNLDDLGRFVNELLSMGQAK